MKNSLKYEIQAYLKVHFPKLYKILYQLVMNYYKYAYREQKRKFGHLNPDKTFYIIRVRREKLGLMGYYNSVLGRTKYAVEKGYIPVVDMQHYRNPYLSEKTFRKVNAWEYYFKQLSEYSLEEVYKSKNVVLSDGETPDEARPRWLFNEVYKTQDIADLYYQLERQYIHLTEQMKKIAEEVYLKIFPKNARVLGISSRGTDLIGFPGHSVQPSKEELLTITKEQMETNHCDYIFLATEEAKVCQFFKNELGDKVIIDERKRFDDFLGITGIDIINDPKSDRENEEYIRGKEYMVTIILLSKCNCLLGTLIGSTLGAIGINQGEYEHVEIYDKGTYH